MVEPITQRTGEPPGIDLAPWETHGLHLSEPRMRILLRPIEPAPELWRAQGRVVWAAKMPDGSRQDVEADGFGRLLKTCPYTSAGEELVGRETWGMHSSGIWYRDPEALRRWDDLPAFAPVIDVVPGERAAATMPSWAARIRLRLLSVSVLNVMDIDDNILWHCGPMPALTTGVWFWQLNLERADIWRPTHLSDFSLAPKAEAERPS